MLRKLLQHLRAFHTLLRGFVQSWEHVLGSKPCQGKYRKELGDEAVVSNSGFHCSR